jgi:hypothetical protein
MKSGDDAMLPCQKASSYAWPIVGSILKIQEKCAIVWAAIALVQCLMVLFDKVRQNAEALRHVGERALCDARKAGIPIHYMDAAFGDDIIREFPDGHRERIPRGGEGVVVAIGPRR